MFTELLNHFHFLRPLWLLAFIALLPAAVYLVKNHAANSNGWQKSIDPNLLEHLLDGSINRKQHLKNYLLILAACLTIITLAGPSWEKLPQPVVKKQDNIVIIVDLSLSMFATDIKPSRLIKTRYKLLELLKQRNEGQTALIAYSGDAHIVSPLSDDAKTISALVPSISPEIMPSIGSNASAAFALANTIIDNGVNAKTKIVWFSDQVFSDEIDDIVKQVKKHGSELYIIGVGTQTGAPIELPTGKFIKDHYDNVVTAKFQPQPFLEIAQRSRGHYSKIKNNNSDIQWLFNNDFTLEQDTLQSDKNSNRQFDQWLDRGPWLAMILMPITLMCFRRGWLLTWAALCLLPISYSPVLEANTQNAKAQAQTSDALPQNKTDKKHWIERLNWQAVWKNRDQQAKALLEQGQASRAAELFNDPQWQAVAEHEAGDYSSAANSFLDSANTLSSIEKANSYYNRGHALAHADELEAAIESYDQALQIQPEMDNARKAKEIVEKLLEQQAQEDAQNDDQQQGNENSSEQDSNNSSDKSNSDNSAEQNSDQNAQQEQQEDASQSNSQQSSSNNGQSQNAQDSPAPLDPQDLTQEPSDNARQETSSQQQEKEAEQTDRQQDAAEQLSAQQDENDDPSASQEQALASSDVNPDDLSPEEQRQLQQWLNKIQDDPGGLLRRKFDYEQRLREREGTRVERRQDGQIW